MNKKTLVVRKLMRLNEGSYTRRILEKLGKRALDMLADNLVSDENFDLKGFFKTQKQLYEFDMLEKQINKLAEDRSTGIVNGESIDGFSAFMVSRVLKKLTFEQKQRLLTKPTNEIVAISYKLASRAEF